MQLWIYGYLKMLKSGNAIKKGEGKMRITQTNGNPVNGIRGCRIRYWNRANELIGEQTVTRWYGVYYCMEHPTGKYGKYHAEMLKTEENAK